MIKEQYKYSDITSKVIGASMEVHKLLGNGFQEVIYQRALEREMLCYNINYQIEYHPYIKQIFEICLHHQYGVGGDVGASPH